MAGPLHGVKIIELAGLGPGPFAAMLLADLGADVLRLERGNPDASAEPHWDLLTRSRPSVALDLKNPAGRDLVLTLCESADALIEGFRPGVAERLGVGPHDVAERNSRLVYGRMTGWGQDGPMAPRAGHDINYIAHSGALWSIGRRGEAPLPPLNLVGDFGGGGMLLAFGVLAAIIEARTSGHGQVVDAAMVDGAATLMAMTQSFLNMGLWHEERGTNMLDTGAPFYEVYETSDHGYMAVGAIERQFYDELLKGLEIDPSTLPNQMDRAQWPAMKEIFARCFAQRTRAEWTKIFIGVDACVTPVLSPSEARVDAHNVARTTFLSVPVDQPAPSPRFSRTPASHPTPAMTPGSGTRDGLRAWGVSDEEIERLKAAGAFG